MSKTIIENETKTEGEKKEITPNGVPISTTTSNYFFQDLVLKDTLSYLAKKDVGWTINNIHIHLKPISKQNIAQVFSYQQQIDSRNLTLSGFITRLRMYDSFIIELSTKSQNIGLNVDELEKISSSVEKYTELKNQVLELKNKAENEYVEKLQEYRQFIGTKVLDIPEDEYVTNFSAYKDLVDAINFGYINQLLNVNITEDTFDILYAEHSKINQLIMQIKNSS